MPILLTPLQQLSARTEYLQRTTPKPWQIADQRNRAERSQGRETTFSNRLARLPFARRRDGRGKAGVGVTGGDEFAGNREDREDQLADRFRLVRRNDRIGEDRVSFGTIAGIEDVGCQPLQRLVQTDVGGERAAAFGRPGQRRVDAFEEKARRVIPAERAFRDTVVEVEIPLAQPEKRLVVLDERNEPADRIVADRRRLTRFGIDDDGGPVGLTWCVVCCRFDAIVLDAVMRPIGLIDAGLRQERRRTCSRASFFDGFSDGPVHVTRCRPRFIGVDLFLGKIDDALGREIEVRKLGRRLRST